jgi:hypothetical protein
MKKKGATVNTEDTENSQSNPVFFSVSSVLWLTLHNP